MLWKISGLAEAGTNWSGWFHNTASKERMGKLQIYLLIKTVGKSHGWDGYRYLGSSSSGMSAARDWGSGAPTVKRFKKKKKNYNIKYIVFHNFLMLNQCCGAAQVNYTKLLVKSFFTKSHHTLVKLDPNPHEKKQPDPDPHKKGMRIHSPGVYAILWLILPLSLKLSQMGLSRFDSTRPQPVQRVLNSEPCSSTIFSEPEEKENNSFILLLRGIAP